MLSLFIFGLLIMFILLGVPVVVSMGITAVITFVALGEGAYLTMLAQRMYSASCGFTLLAIPFFILAGNLMNTGGITNRIFRFAKALVGHLWGGLGQVNIMASLIFSGMSGAAVADAAGLGLIEIKAMSEDGYDLKFSSAITAASSTIGPVVPPSIPFVIYGSMTGVSVGSLFLAGFVPGFLMCLAMMIAVYFISKKRNYPKRERASFKELLISFKEAVLSLLTPIIIIGGIIGGIFTPTEAAVVASFYAFILGFFIYKELKVKQLKKILWSTLTSTIQVMFIISVAGFFSWLLIHQQIPQQLITSLVAISSNKYIIMLIIVAILLILGCFLEGIAVLVITIPIFMPIIRQIGFEPVQFGVIMILASMLGLLTPPVGMSLYAVASITDISIGKLSKELIPYLIGIFIVLLLIIFFPQLALLVPNLFQ